MNFRVLQIVLWALVAVAGGYFLFTKDGGPSRGTEPAPAQVASVDNPYVKLLNTSGETVDTKAFDGAHQLLYFGFTYCPDVCPIGVRKMVTASALYQLANTHIPLKTYFASFDVERDTADVLAEYEANIAEAVASDFSDSEQAALALELIALTGDQAAMDAALGQFPVYVAQVTDPDQPDGYTYTHTDIIYWVQPGGTVRLLSARHSAADIAKMLQAWS